LTNETLWELVNTLVRITTVLFIFRVFKAYQERGLWVGALLVLSILYGTAILLDIFLICRPVAAARDTSISGECGNQLLSYVLLEIFGLLIDLAILVTPPSLIYRLQMPWKRKASVSGMLSVGVL